MSGRRERVIRSVLGSATSVILPLISPFLLTVALIVCLNVWNEFLIAITFLQNADAATATARFYQLTGHYGNNLADLMAVATIIALPTLVSSCSSSGASSKASRSAR